MSSANNSVLSFFLALNLVKEGKMIGNYGSLRTPLQSQGAISARSEPFTLAPGAGVNVWQRPEGSEQAIPGIILIGDSPDLYYEILTDTAPSTNQKNVIIEMSVGVPVVISGWNTLTNFTGGTAGMIRRVFVQNASLTNTAVLEVYRIEGETPA